MRTWTRLCAAALLCAACADDLSAEMSGAALRVSVAQIPVGVASLRVEAVRAATGERIGRAPRVDPDATLVVYFDALEAGHYALRVSGLDAAGRARWCAARDEVELARAGVAVAIELSGADARACGVQPPSVEDEDAGSPPDDGAGGREDHPDEVHPPEVEQPEGG